MPTVARSPLANAAKATKRRAEPLWAGPGGEGPQGGVSQSLLGRYLCCKERFRLQTVEGLATAPRFEHRMEFGNMWHVCEESLAKYEMTRNASPWESSLLGYVRWLQTKFPMQREEIDGWAEKCRALFPLYVDHWAKHPDVKDRTPLLQEQVFDVPYRMPSGRTVRLRGKFDSVDLVGKGKTAAAVWLQENKTKSAIDGRKIEKQMAFDLQTMMYLVGLMEFQRSLRQDSRSAEEWSKTAPNWKKMPGQVFDRYIAGVRYNVVWRSAHKSVESMLKKLEEDRAAGRIGEWFARWNVKVGADDVAKFRRECLDPVLENLCDDFEWWSACYAKMNVILGADIWDTERRHKAFPEHCPRHFRFPFGVYHPLGEGGTSDLDEHMATGSLVGLRRADDLFPELNGG